MPLPKKKKPRTTRIPKNYLRDETEKKNKCKAQNNAKKPFFSPYIFKAKNVKKEEKKKKKKKKKKRESEKSGRKKR